MNPISLQVFLLGLAAGLLVRILLLQVDYRQYPSYPHNFVAHVTTGVIAAVIGAIFAPAIDAGEYTAATFLALAATQFREVRNVERQTLKNLEPSLLVPRGPDYVEGIAAVFEARNYLVMGAALCTTVPALAAGKIFGVAGVWLVGLPAAALTIVLATRLRSGQRIGDVAVIEPAPLEIQDAGLLVGGIFIMNIGSPEAQAEALRWGRGYKLQALTEAAAAKLSHPGQRQALLHDVAAVLGTRKDVAMPELTPLIRQDVASGTYGVYVTPAVGDDEAIIAVMKRVPLLESARGSDPRTFGVEATRNAR